MVFAAGCAVVLALVVLGVQSRPGNTTLTSLDAGRHAGRAVHAGVEKDVDSIDKDVDKTEKDIKGLGDRLIKDFDSMVLLHRGAKNVTGETEKGDWLIRMGLKQAGRASELKGRPMGTQSPELDAKWIKTFRDQARKHKVPSTNIIHQIKTAEVAYHRLQGSMQKLASAVDQLDTFVKDAKKNRQDGRH